MRYRYSVRTGVHQIQTKAFTIVSTLGLLLGSSGMALVVAGTASAAAPTTPTAYTPRDCSGKQIVNVTYSLSNDADSGFFSPQWATDSLNRSLQIFDQGNGMYCATVNDTGSFVTTGPVSPEYGAPLASGIKGVINGGYVTSTFSATLNQTPDYAVHGNLGTFDATLAHPSFLSYFNNPGAISWSQPVWGWTYHTAQNGKWVNASSGSYGDIAD
jgi:hypothetical protein